MMSYVKRAGLFGLDDQVSHAALKGVGVAIFLQESTLFEARPIVLPEPELRLTT